MEAHQWTDAKEGTFVVTEAGRLQRANGADLGSLPSVLLREILRLVEENAALKRVGGFDRVGADRLADEVASLVARGLLDSRSGAADALLDYREPPRSERSDRLADLETERDRLAEEVERCREVHRADAVALDGALKEVERLKEQNGLLRQGQSGDLLELGAELERGRIRRELLAWYEHDTGEESFPQAFARICPEEG